MPDYLSAQRNQSVSNRVFAPIGAPSGGRRNPPPVTNASGRLYSRSWRVLLRGAWQMHAGDQAQDSAEVEGQQADEQQAGVTNDRYGDRHEARDSERADNRDDGPSEANSAAPAGERQETEQQEPLPDVGTLTLVLRDGSRLDVVAFTMTQGQVIYITPEGRRLSDLSGDFRCGCNATRESRARNPDAASSVTVANQIPFYSDSINRGSSRLPNGGLVRACRGRRRLAGRRARIGWWCE